MTFSRKLFAKFCEENVGKARVVRSVRRVTLLLPAGTTFLNVNGT